MILLLVGCLDPISNRLFFEDAEFLDALPSAEDDRVQVHTHSVDPEDEDTTTKPGDQLVAPAGAPELLVLTFESINGVNAMVDGFLTIVDAVRQIPPSSRTEDSRTWGPFPMDNAPGHEVRMVSTRDGLSEFTWRFETTPQGTSDWTTFFSGIHYAGETVRDGFGTFDFDGFEADEINGSQESQFLLFVQYDHTVGNTVSFSVWGDASLRQQDPLAKWEYTIDEDDVGSFAFDTTDASFAAGDDGDEGAVEEMQVTTHWVPDVGGRGDATVSGGDLEKWNTDITYTQCWLPDGTLLYQADEPFWFVKDVGLEEDCTVAP